MTTLNSLNLNHCNTNIIVIITIFIVVSFVNAQSTYPEYQIANTQAGTVRGQLNHSLFFYVPYYSFRGIRFAEPPVGQLRFKPPQPAYPWNGTFDAFEYSSACIQTERASMATIGNEDCLFLNVFVPASSSSISEQYSVMIFIGGGAYISGDAASYGPDFLIEKNVILVTFNYRIGPMGFLSLGTPTYSGNMGLKDQLLAFKWVQNNIEYFGGNKNSVTIFGQSAGSASISIHLVSPASKGLFARAIMESGSLLDTWGFKSTTNQLPTITKFARRFANSSQYGESLVQFLINCKADTIERHNFRYFVQGPPPIHVSLVWAPVIEVEGAVEPIMQKSPIELLLERGEKSPVDTMFGFNSNEVIYFIPLYIQNPNLLAPINRRFQVQLPWSFTRFNYTSPYYLTAATDIQAFYFGPQSLTPTTFPLFTNLLSDAWFNYGIYKNAAIQQKRSSGKVFFYKNSVVTKLNIFRKTSGAGPNIPGATHCDELFYLFKITGQLFYHDIGNIYSNLPFRSEEIRMIRLFTSVWTDFAKYGNPTHMSQEKQAIPLSNNDFHYMHLTNRGIKIKKNPNGKRLEFWQNFYKSHDFPVKKITYCAKAAEAEASV